MAIQVILYQIRKDKNSTTRPSGTGNPYMVELKDQCSVTDPVLVFDFGAFNYPSGFNYLCIPVFENRCYWVENWQYFRGCWQASCHVDALASWRADIGNSEQYIIRAAADFDGRIVDNLYPTIAEYSTAQTPPTGDVVDGKVFRDNLQAGGYILGVISRGVTGFGSVAYYVLDNAAFTSLRRQLLNNTDYLGISANEVSENLSKALFNPMQYIVSCRWYPFTIPVQPAFSTSTIYIGWWALDIDSPAYVVSDGYDKATFNISFSLPGHPQRDRGEYTNCSPYTKRSLYFPPFGDIDIPTSFFVDSSELNITVTVDLYSGIGYLYIYGQGNQVETRQAEVSVDIPLAQIAASPISSIGEVVGAGTNFFNGIISGLVNWAAKADAGTGGGTFPEALNDAAVGVGDAITADRTKVSMIGKAGTLSVYNKAPFLLSVFGYIADDDTEHRGRPLMQRRRVSSLPGYQICDRPHIECHATASEISEIESAMSTGFFWE